MGFNVAALRSSHQHILAKSQRAIDEELAEAARFAAEHVLDYSTFKSRTGKLVAATKGRVVRLGSGRVVKVSNAKKYAAAIDLGAKPHVIRAKHSKFLRFRVGGRLVFARSVNHPGNRAYRFLYRATFAAARRAGKQIEARLQRVAHDRN